MDFQLASYHRRCDLARSQVGVEYMFARMDYDLKCIAMHGIRIIDVRIS